MAATFQDLVNQITVNTSAEASAAALIKDIAGRLQVALAANDPVAIQAEIDLLNSSATPLSAAVAANTTQGPLVPTPPVVPTS